MKLVLAALAASLLAAPALGQDDKAANEPLALTPFANGWVYGEPGNSCIARLDLPGKRSATIRLTNWDGFDGRVILEGPKLPFVPDDKWGSPYAQLAEKDYDTDPNPNWVDLKPEFTMANFPDTALFIDGKLASLMVIAETPEGKKQPDNYTFNVYQPQLISYLASGTTMTVVANGKTLLDIPVAESAEMAARMKACATKYNADAG
jgi:hypothetical protein